MLEACLLLKIEGEVDKMLKKRKDDKDKEHKRLQKKVDKILEEADADG